MIADYSTAVESRGRHLEKPDASGFSYAYRSGWMLEMQKKLGGTAFATPPYKTLRFCYLYLVQQARS